MTDINLIPKPGKKQTNFSYRPPLKQPGEYRRHRGKGENAFSEVNGPECHGLHIDYLPLIEYCSLTPQRGRKEEINAS